LSKDKLLDCCDLQGVDIDKSAVAKSVDPVLELSAMSVESYSENNTCQFDLVVHFELIEHLSDPFKFMVSINNLLKSSGIHHFHTPNALGMDNVAMGWNSTRLLAYGIFPPMHIKAFTTQNIFHFHYVQVLMLFL
jgi:2-polyprenyl-6-hydroxyphenyl methylase/3-demethylubiquinone-9 3-methyltransferase